MRKNYPTSLVKQQGITFWHVMLLVAVAVTLAVCAKKGTIPFFQTEAPVIGRLNMPSMPSLPTFSGGNKQNYQQSTQYYEPQDIQTPQITQKNVESLMTTASHSTQVTAPPKGSAYELQYPRDLASGYYTVQVFSGYNSKSAYDLQKALKRDGYRAYIHSEETNQGILFKVRIGQYSNRSDAFAMKSKIRLSYPKKLGKSFVLLRQ
ncbi:MAG: SPOR domain-containing protein [Thiolinea sp.]